MREKHQRGKSQQRIDQEQCHDEGEASLDPIEPAIGNGGDSHNIERTSEEKQGNDGRWHALVIAQVTGSGKAQFFGLGRTWTKKGNPVDAKNFIEIFPLR